MIELGCGCGLVGLCFAARGAHVLLTDLPAPLVRALFTCSRPSLQCAVTRSCVECKQPWPTILMSSSAIGTMLSVDICAVCNLPPGRQHATASQSMSLSRARPWHLR